MTRPALHHVARRVIAAWQQWRSHRKLAKAIPGWRENKAAIRQAQKAHRPVKHLYARQKATVHSVLAGRS